MPFYFPAIGEYATILEQQGLQVRYAVLFERLTELKGEDGLADWIRMFVKKPFEGMNQEMQEEIIDEAETVYKLLYMKTGNGMPIM